METARLSYPLDLISSVSSTSQVFSDGILGVVTFPDCDDFVVRVIAEDDCGRLRTATIALQLQSPTAFLASITTFSTRGRDPGEHRKPTDVVVDREDYVWVVDSLNRRVQKYTADGRLLLEVGSHATGSATGITFSEPIAAAVDSGNEILILDRQTGIVTFLDESGKLVGSLPGSSASCGNLNHPEGIWVDEADRVYVADTQHDRVVVRDALGNLLSTYGTHGSGSGELNRPKGISVAQGSSRQLVADSVNDRVCFFGGENDFLGSFGATGAAPTEFRAPYEAVLGSDNNLFVSDTHNDRVAWWTVGGGRVSLLTLLPPPGLGIDLFRQPHGLALDRQESVLYVADTGHDRIVAIRVKRAVDTQPPRAIISSPASGQPVAGTFEIRGIAADAHFYQYQLEAGAGEQPGVLREIAVSSTPVWDDCLGRWDTASLASGVYTLRLTVLDASGNTAVASATVFVQGVPAPLIVSAYALPAAFMPDRAGLQIAYQLSVPASVTAVVIPLNSNHPLWMAEALPNAYGGLAGPNTMAWDGRDEGGQPVAPGAYVALLVVRAGDRMERWTISLLALLSPEAQVAALAGPGSSGAAGPGGGAGGASAGASSSGSAGTVGGGGTGTSSAAAGGRAAAGTGTALPSGTPHDNGWHEGNNPNGFVIDHDDKSQGGGNNHH